MVTQHMIPFLVQVFFPMLTRLLDDIQTGDRLNLEETRVRASNLLCKVSK